MLRLMPSSCAAGKRVESVRPVGSQIRFAGTNCSTQLVGEQRVSAAPSSLKLLNDVIFLRMHCDREIRRQRPWRRRPDRDAGLVCRSRRLTIGKLARKRRCRRGPGIPPRLRPAPSARRCSRKPASSIGKRDLSRRRRRKRAGFPLRSCGSSVRYGFSQSPKTPSRLNCSRWMSMNLRANASDLLRDFERRKAARFLHHLVFDRQAVAVPARHVRRAFAQHGLRFHDEIFEDFVERGAHVDVAVGEWRTIVQDE